MSFIHLRTAIPGPKSKQLLGLKRQHISSGVPTEIPVFVKEASNALLTDVDGNTFIDFAAGVSAVNSGHCNPSVVEAIRQQAQKYIHTCFGIVPYEPYVRLCEKLNTLTPGSFTKKSVLFNSGAEAVENAIKVARKYTGRPGVISFEHGFHGRTLLTMSLTSKIKPYKFGFGPFAPEVYKIPYPYVYRRPAHLSEDAYVDDLLEHLETVFFKGVVDPEHVACLVMEPITGEGGFLVPPKRYVRKLVDLCHTYGIVFIADEIQTGFCRTGKFFASEHFGVAPDLVTVAKSMSNGMPLSGVVGRADIMDSIQEGGFGGTFSGNPLSCAAALATIQFMQKNHLDKKAQTIGQIVQKRFFELAHRSSHIGDVRGLGAMNAVEFVTNKSSKEPDPKRAERALKECYTHGLMLLKTGILDNDIRTLMPLTIEHEVLEEGLDVLSRAVRAVA